jgi:TetR/AcrR family transcriptional regulator, transcriptional repressor for nem operon
MDIRSITDIGFTNCVGRCSTKEVVLFHVEQTRGNACCKRLFGRSTAQAFRVLASIPSWPTPESLKEHSTYHFGSKEALGYVIVEEIVAALPRDKWLRPLQEGKDPIDALIDIVQATSVRPKDVQGGCPLVNLAQEMSPLDEQFRKRLERIFNGWQEGIATALRRGQSQGTVRRDLVPEETATFLIAMYEGYVLLAKNAQDPKMWNVGIRNIVGWLRSLRTPRQSRGGGRRLTSKERVVKQRQ